jgi:hypothetical protein
MGQCPGIQNQSLCRMMCDTADVSTGEKKKGRAREQERVSDGRNDRERQREERDRSSEAASLREG